MHDVNHVVERCNALKVMNDDTFADRWRIRAILNGGVDGMAAMMAWDMGKGASMASRGRVANLLGVDLPAMNMIASGLDSLGRKLGRPPTLKPPKANKPDIREAQQKKVDVIAQWDEDNEAEMWYPQIGRWLPGYAFYIGIVTQRRNDDGDLYPCVELRDSWDVYPGWFGANQQPRECSIRRKVPLGDLQRTFPNVDWDALEPKIKTAAASTRTSSLVDAHGSAMRIRSWEGKNTGIGVVEYYDETGQYLVIPEIEVLLIAIENPLSTPAFAFGKRIAFDKLISHYQHVIGLNATLAKLNILGLVSIQDNVFRPLDYAGELISGDYDRNRGGVNQFERGTQLLVRPTENQVQTWAQIDRIEKQLRIGAGYDPQQDGISPNSFATGEGMRELSIQADDTIREYQTVMARWSKNVDRRRLEWAQLIYKNQKLSYWDMNGAKSKYQPAKLIDSDYRTRRIYGAMATWDDNSKIVASLQLLQAGVLDVETIQENLDGLVDIELINQRITKKEAEDTLYDLMRQRSLEDPRAIAALADIIKNPEDKVEILVKYFSPQPEPELSEEEMATMAAMQQGAMPTPEGLEAAPEPFSTVLSRLEQGGGTEGGVQTVGALA